MKTLVKTGNLTHEEWLRYRTKGIGGSDVSVLFGCNPFKSIYELWQEKTGQIIPAAEESEFAHFGKVFEPIVKKEFMARTGFKVRAKNVMLQSEEYPFMLADLDGVINDNGELVIFEAKTASAYKLSEWEKGVPFGYILQVQHYMAVTGAKKAYVAAIVGGQHYFQYLVERDEVLIQKIIAVEKKFWEDNILSGMEPIADGSPATTAYLNQTYKDSNGESIELPPEMLTVFESYDRVSEKLDVLKERKEALANQIKANLKGNEYGFIGNRKVRWQEVHTTRFDQKRMAQEQPEEYKKYLTESRYRKLVVA